MDPSVFTYYLRVVPPGGNIHYHSDLYISMASSQQRTTVSVDRETLSRLKSAKPHDSMSYDEFVNDVLDRVEGDCDE